ncbi:MAG: hypothetical protein R3E39_12720 [Anaerolineae bacterium]
MIRLIAFLSVFLMLSTTIAFAQGGNAPVILDIDGDYFAYDVASGQLNAITNSDGNNRLPVLSPDGRTLAFATVAPVAIEAMQRVGGIAGGELPTDIHLLDVASRQETVIAVQPEDAALMSEGVENKYIVRGTPAWSPDSSQLAWAEYDEKGEEQALVIYDITSGTSESSTTVPFPIFSVPNPVRLMWGRSGLIVENILPYVNPDNFNVNENIGATSYSLYPLKGQDFQIFQPPFTDAEFPFGAALALRTSDGQEFLVVAYNKGAWKLYNLSTGEEQPVPGNEIQMVSSLSPDISQRLWVGASMPINIYNVTSSEREPVGGPLDETYNDLEQFFAMSPDGSAFVYMDYYADDPAPVTFAAIWRNAGLTLIHLPQGKHSILSVLWGPHQWQIDEAVGIDSEGVPTPPAFDCPGSQLPPRLTVGGRGQVTAGGGSNRMRAAPSTDGVQVGTIPELGVFDVHDGPFCASGIIWWQVIYNGDIGWTAEGVNADYFVEPVN